MDAPQPTPEPPPAQPWWKNSWVWLGAGLAVVFAMFATAVAIQTTAVENPDFPFAQILLVVLAVGVGGIFILAQVLGHRPGE
ncbi:MAG: hypothetical protein ACYTGX_19365 [Planctomycetota bacterium]